MLTLLPIVLATGYSLTNAQQLTALETVHIAIPNRNIPLPIFRHFYIKDKERSCYGLLCYYAICPELTYHIQHVIAI